MDESLFKGVSQDQKEREIEIATANLMLRLGIENVFARVPVFGLVPQDLGDINGATQYRVDSRPVAGQTQITVFFERRHGPIGDCVFVEKGAFINQNLQIEERQRIAA